MLVPILLSHSMSPYCQHVQPPPLPPQKEYLFLGQGLDPLELLAEGKIRLGVRSGSRIRALVLVLDPIIRQGDLGLFKTDNSTWRLVTSDMGSF